MRGILAALAAVVAVQAWAAKPLPVWSVSQPYPERLIKVATLAGRGKSAEERFDVRLLMHCSNDGVKAAVQLPVDVPGWNYKPFEGPQGVGQKMHLVTVATRGSREVDRPLASGWLTDADTFQLSWKPGEGFVERLVPASTALVVTVEGVGAGTSALRLSFALPDDDGPLQEALKSCKR